MKLMPRLSALHAPGRLPSAIFQEFENPGTSEHASMLSSVQPLAAQLDPELSTERVGVTGAAGGAGGVTGWGGSTGEAGGRGGIGRGAGTTDSKAICPALRAVLAK